MRAITRWLEQCQSPWLLIFDNADDLALVQEYLPQQGNGRVLLTTRANAIGSLAESLEVENMGLMEGTHFLLRRAHRQAASEEESNEATNVVIALDSFPLALEQAGAYIEETGCSFGDYLQLYQSHRQTLLARRGRQATNYPDSVATTWSLSFQKIEQQSPAAADLLRLCALLAPDHIPEELLREGAPYWSPVLQQAAADLLTFNQMIEQLLTFSLVKRLAEDQMLSIHRLVQVVQLERMEAGEQRQWAERIVRAVNAVFPAQPEEVSSWPQCLRYLEQVQACDTLIQKERLVLVEAADLLDRSGTYLRKHASYALAHPLYQRALSIREQQLGPHHLETAKLLNNLGLLYWEQGKYEQAEPLYVRALSICEQQLGSHHLLTAEGLFKLGLLYLEQGTSDQAEHFLVRALSIQEQILTPQHPDRASTLDGLARLSATHGHLQKAVAFYQQVLTIREQVYGPHHRKTIQTHERLSAVLLQISRTEKEGGISCRASRKS